MTTDTPETPAALTETFDACRVGDALFARAYAKTGDRGRALIKSSIARLFEARNPGGPVAATLAERFPGGGVRTQYVAARPWFALVLDPETTSPAQLVAAVMPAVAARIPLVAVLRPKGRGPWPHALLTTLELCGVEQVFSPTLAQLGECLSALRERHGVGGVACLGFEPFWNRVRPLCAPASAVHWLRAPSEIGLLDQASLEWDREAVAFAHAGTALREYPDAAALAAAGHDAVLARTGAAPGASLTLEPGCETLWDWPEMPRELFFGRRLVYS
ncbi:hypothetical protein [Fundidesulfovibrio terrae]|uniref:hypothetical protein n=1 Tax=Fundidesulfovibrio terrae TaxID=2922866 RepID=UPI001FAFA51F|nr:hypothetical protein [Fundidesulfovibrio terrae]